MGLLVVLRSSVLSQGDNLVSLLEDPYVLPMHRGPFVDMGEVCLKWADNLWYVGSASHKLCLATYGPIVEY